MRPRAGDDEILRRLAFVTLLIAAILLGSLPTLQFSTTGLTSGVLSSRMVWLPFVLLSAALGIAFGTAYRQLGSAHPLLVLAAVVYLVSMGVGGHLGLTAYRGANEYSRRATEIFRRYCSCLDFDREQVRGMQRIPFGVNTFTEDDWLLYNAMITGVPRCSAIAAQALEAESCRIEYRTSDGILEGIPERVAASRMTEILASLPRAGWVGSEPGIAPLGYHVDSFPVARCPSSLPAKLRINGWIEVGTERAPAEAIALLADGRPILVTRPNVFRVDRATSLEERRHTDLKRGFEVTLDQAAVPPGTRRLELAALFRSPSAAHEMQTKRLAKVDLTCPG
jgi:hypothetical protein